MKLLRYELKKMLSPTLLRAALLSLIAVNALLFFYVYKTDLPWYKASDSHFSAYHQLYEKVGGQLRNENVRFINDEYERLNTIFLEGNYSRDYNPDTYTGYIAGDFNFIWINFYSPIKYAVTYKTDSDEIVQKAQENIQIFTDSGNSFEAKNNKKIINIYSNRKIANFYDYFGTVSLFQYVFSVIAILLLTIVAVTPIFISEKESEMQAILDTSAKGGRETVLAKISAVLVWNFAVCLLFSIIDFILFAILHHNFEGWGEPLYAIEIFKLTPLNWPVLGYFLFTRLLLFIGLSVIFAVMLCISQKHKRVLLPYILNFILVAALYSIYALRNEGIFKALNFFNPLNLLLPIDMFKGYTAANIFGSPITYPALIFAGVMSVLIVSVLFMIKGSRNKAVSRGKG